LYAATNRNLELEKQLRETEQRLQEINQELKK
jgi:hypothetical protein